MHSTGPTTFADRLIALRMRALARDMAATAARPAPAPSTTTATAAATSGTGTAAATSAAATAAASVLETIRTQFTPAPDRPWAGGGHEEPVGLEAKVRARVHSFLQTDYAERALLHTRVANGERELAAMFLQQEMHAQEIPRIGMTGGASLEHLVERARYVVAQQVENDEATRGHLEDAVGSHHDTLWHGAMQRTA